MAKTRRGITRSDTDPDTINRIRQKLDAREAFYEEILNYDRNGNSYWISLVINPVLDKEGSLENFIAIQANVTETKLKTLEYNYKLDAIDRANAVAEFDLNGKITAANKNYLTIFGFESENQHSAAR